MFFNTYTNVYSIRKLSLISEIISEINLQLTYLRKVEGNKFFYNIIFRRILVKCCGDFPLNDHLQSIV